VNVWGARVHSPSPDRAVAAWLLNAGFMGRAERRFFEQVVTAGQTVVDVGANQGVFTLLLSRLVGPAGKVFALEPEPRLFHALEESCRRNRADNVTRLQLAAGESRGHGLLRCSRLNGGDNRLTRLPGGSTVPVEIAGLDEILPDQAVNLIKIDVQGYELRVAKGMQKILDRSPAIRVCFEYWPAGLRKAGDTPEALLRFFHDRGFSVFDLTNDGLREFRPRETGQSIAAGDWSWRNLVAVREQGGNGAP
jgi:FkbM family methyltransferase